MTASSKRREVYSALSHRLALLTAALMLLAAMAVAPASGLAEDETSPGGAEKSSAVKATTGRENLIETELDLQGTGSLMPKG